MGKKCDYRRSPAWPLVRAAWAVRCWLGWVLGYEQELKRVREHYAADVEPRPLGDTVDAIEAAVWGAVPADVDVQFRNICIPGMARGVLKVEVRHGCR